MTAEPPAWQLWETCSPGRPRLSHTHSTSISIFALSFFLSGLFLFIPDVCFIPPALICSHVSRCSPGWIHKGLIARDVSLSARLSFHLFSGSCFIAAVHFSPPHSLRAPACLSLCHFNLHSLSVCACQSFPSSLLFCFHHSSVFSAEVSADSSHIFFPTALLSLPPLILPAPHLPVPYFHAWSKSDNTSSAPPPIRKKKSGFHKDTAQSQTIFFSFLDHSAVTMLLTLSRAIFRSVRGDTLHSYHTTDSLGIRLSNMNDDTYHEMIERTLLLCYRQPFNIYEYNGLWLQVMMSII